MLSENTQPAIPQRTHNVSTLAVNIKNKNIMTVLDTLIEAIKSRKPVSFEYNKAGKVIGTRIGNPHAVFIFTSKTGATSTKIHLVQTEGVSDSVDLNPFPDFRMFNIEELSNMVILKNSLVFEPHYEKYNPEWEGYKDVIEKV